LQLRWTEWAFSGWNKGFFPWGLKWCANSLRLAWHLPTSRSRTREQQNSCVDGLRSNLKWFQHLKICFYIFLLFVPFILSNKQYLMSVFHSPLFRFLRFQYFWFHFQRPTHDISHWNVHFFIYFASLEVESRVQLVETVVNVKWLVKWPLEALGPREQRACQSRVRQKVH
jgi:hypothetical protein